jgi:predicted metal-dependent hydrolase
MTSEGPVEVEVRRSARRRRTVSAYREQGRTIVLIPARFTRAQEREWVATMVARLQAKDRRRRPTDDALADRAAELSRRYLGGRAQPTTVAWVDNQRSRWGSCTPADGSIRISSRLRDVPPWVLDYVLLHELAHLLQADHSPQFWALTAGVSTHRARRGFLEGYAAGARTEPLGPDADLPEDAADGCSEPDDDAPD